MNKEPTNEYKQTGAVTATPYLVGGAFTTIAGALYLLFNKKENK